MNAALLEAAAQLFTEKGFAAASMAEISERAGISRQTLYARFPNKTVLFEALMEARATALLSSISSLLSDRGSPREVLQRFGERLVGQFINSDIQSLHRVVIAEAATFPHLAIFFFRNGPDRGKELLMGYLQKQTELGNLVITDVESAAEQLVGSLVGTIIVRATLLQPQRLGSNAISEWVRAAVRLFLCGYQRPSSLPARPVPRINKTRKGNG